MKLVSLKSLVVLALVVTASVGQASIINGQNWADDVISYTSAVQNYAGTLMSSATEFWVLGPSDADDNHDYVAGWRGGSANQEIVVQFEDAITDISGNDLIIRLYRGPNASASVSVSSDNANWVTIGSISCVSPSGFYNAAFDFSGQISSVNYVKVHRDAAGAKTGMFFDSFASVPEPITVLFLGLGALSIVRRK